MSAEGVKRSALLLMSLGDEAAGAVLRELEPGLIAEISKVIPELGEASTSQMQEATSLFSRTVGTAVLFPIEAISESTPETLKAINITEDHVVLKLSQSVPKFPVKATTEPIQVQVPALDPVADLPSVPTPAVVTLAVETTPAPGLASPANIANMLDQEHPQVVASVLLHMPADKAAAVLRLFPERLRHDVLGRIATTADVHPDAVFALKEVFAQLKASGQKLNKASVLGAKAAAALVSSLDSNQESAALSSLASMDQSVARKVEALLPGFEEFVKANVGLFLASASKVPSNVLLKALKGSPDIAKILTDKLNPTTSDILQSKLVELHALKLSDIQDAQQEICKVMRSGH